MRNQRCRNCFWAILAAILVVSCDEQVVPKPRGYLRLEFPKAVYHEFAPEGCPYAFDISDQSVAIQDTNRVSEPCWWYIRYPSLDAELYLTYKPLHDDLVRYIEDSRALVYKHTSKASAIDEFVVRPRPGVNGIRYEIGGDAASSLQFFLTDSVRHFMRGALYFNAAPNIDSLAPALDHIRHDVDRMMSSFRWR